MFWTLVVCCLFTILIYKSVVTKENNESTHNIGLDYKDVNTTNGEVRGQRASGGDYFAFLGIPYAAPPVGENRFKAPLPPPSWDGVYHANRTVKCPQFGEGDEDCLILNIFTPIKINNHSIPVLVYIHGGSFIMGSGQIQGVDPLIKQDIIVVTVNYRLGALGFLCLGIDEAPGNAGLKDQVAALKWVRDNIDNFGGDPNDVAVYGMSAGGASVEFLVLSKMARGLFKKAMIESGAATAVWTTDSAPIDTAVNVAEALNFTKSKNVYKLIDQYRHVPADRLSQINNEYYSSLTDGTFGFVPCVERMLLETEPFLTESPYNIMKNNDYIKVPMMFLFASVEGLYLRSAEYYEQNYRERMESNFLEFVPADLIFDTGEIRDEIARNIKQYYFGNKTIGNETIMEYLNYFGDYLVLHGILNSAEAHSKDGNPVYLMEFSFKGDLGSEDDFYKDIDFAGHGDVIKHAILNKPVRTENDKITVDRISELIANFVKFADPTPNRTLLLPVAWPAVKPNNVSCLHLEKEFQIIEEPYWGRKVFWDKLYEKFRRSIKAVDSKLRPRFVK